jgi:hypothetical protein
MSNSQPDDPTKEQQCSICERTYVNGKQDCTCNAGPLQPLSSNQRVDQRLRSKIGGFLLEPDTNDGGDTLAIALCSYFERHMNRPRPDPDTENGWGQWAEEKTNAALDALTKALMPQVETKATLHAELQRVYGVADHWYEETKRLRAGIESHRKTILDIDGVGSASDDALWALLKDSSVEPTPVRDADQLCKRCRCSYRQHTKGPAKADYCRHCACPGFVPYSPEKASGDGQT